MRMGCGQPERRLASDPEKETEMTSQSPSRTIPADLPAPMLPGLAEAEHADFVVGASRRRELSRPLPRTTAERALEDAPCSVAVAPPVYTDADIRRIGVAYDGSPEADAALRAADSLASDLSAALTVYCLVGSTSIPVREISGENGRPAPSAAVGSATRRYRPGTQVILGVPAEEIAGRAYGVVDLLFVHRALLNNVSGAGVRAAGCPVVVS
jgi:nucleotide-binding universal stress UspA family protein